MITFEEECRTSTGTRNTGKDCHLKKSMQCWPVKICLLVDSLVPSSWTPECYT